ncbi:glycosyltransferase family 4 protein [Geodermatophilus sp. SYSU D00700]
MLPLRAGRKGLWSPCNFGPAIVKNQVVTVHDTALFDHPEWYDRRYAFMTTGLQRALFHQAHIVTPSHFTAERIAALAPQARVHVIPWATTVPLETQPSRPPGFPERPFLLSVGSLQPRKNYQTVLTAWARLQGLRDETQLVIVGSTNNLFAESNAESRTRGVRYLGYVDDSQLAWLYENCRAYINMSHYEGFGLTPHEATAYHAPVIVSDIPSHREFLHSTGASFIAPNDVDALAAAMDGARRGELLPSKPVQVRTWSQVAEDYDRHLTDLLR